MEVILIYIQIRLMHHTTANEGVSQDEGNQQCGAQVDVSQ